MTDSGHDLLAELEARAASRRRDGTYPPDVDAELSAEVEARLRAVSTHTTALRAAQAQLRDFGPFEMPSYRGTDRLKRWYAKAIDKVVGHALADLVAQLEAHRIAVERVLDALVEATEPADAEPAGTDDDR